ncbi:uncharacterized protein MYCFIDRAFT_184895 [Pseudocercospora fijiensis CIRAD86]|uniref:UBZ4-type domain-containing protein n=1 Tax=Pseudocercospora fijiensis (strain CIRAD86) TaxID=383855 RepID=N1QAT4_PSEFD|nr:uncharacterized protein MYCFIDRAFT_184895 [Pseudocercospora fijiensis CIRAD86]EME88103.1 hypothetical protein MYCFIDRAFT_184895 [Pseudocercospora fijiensis CIRAD86]
MNRPRNRQPKQPRGGRGRGRGRGGGSQHSSTRPNEYHAVPGTEQVIAGASVSIVLKQDQGTGREVQGIVQDILSSGNHPRGIKVRLRDGRVGRVQRRLMSDGGEGGPAISQSHQGYNTEYRDAGGNDGFRQQQQQQEGLPPPRTLAQFLPASDGENTSERRDEEFTFSSATAKCPICGLFEGDEVAVSHHVDSHLT